MAVSRSVLGMNARNFLYIRKYNPPRAKRIADNKLAAKRLFIRNGIPTAGLVTVFDSFQSVKKFSWNLPENGFVVKPARGYGGEGILVFKNWKNGIGETISGQTYTSKQLESHLLDILEGAYSLQYLPDKGYIEEKITPAPFFKKLSPFGLADVRIITFNKVPVMAMLRLPTRESQGKANLHMGAIGVGVELSTGITTHALLHDKLTQFIPETKIKIRGIKIPHWDDMLFLAAKTQSVCGLGIVGVDIVIDAHKGPMVLEINARPGLRIQNANMTSLRSRLERIENIAIPTVERGVELAKSLFAEEFAAKVKTGPRVLSIIEPVTIHHNTASQTVEAKIDTGAYRTSIDKAIVQSLGLPILPEKIFVSSASGQGYRPAVHVQFNLAGKSIQSIATVANRAHLQYSMIVGRKDLRGFLVDPGTVDTPDIEDYREREETGV